MRQAEAASAAPATVGWRGEPDTVARRWTPGLHRCVRVRLRSQAAATDCGLACLQMVLAHHGRHVLTRELRASLRPGRDGVTALAIVECARRHGLTAEGFSVEFDDLAALPVPAILLTTSAHFVVFEGSRADWVHLVDPIAGRLRLDRTTASALLTRTALAFEPAAAFRRLSRWSTLWTSLGPLLSFEKQTVLLVIGAMIVVAALAFVGAVELSQIVVAYGPGPARVFPHSILALAGAALGGVGGWAASRAAHASVASQLSERLAARVVKRLAEDDGRQPDVAHDVVLGRFRDCDPTTSHAFPDFSRLVLLAGVVGAAAIAGVRPATDVAMLGIGLLGATAATVAAAELIMAGEVRRRVALHAMEDALRVLLEHMWPLRAPWDVAERVPRWTASHAEARGLTWRDTLYQVALRAGHALLGLFGAYGILQLRARTATTNGRTADVLSAVLLLLLLFAIHRVRDVLVVTRRWLELHDGLDDVLADAVSDRASAGTNTMGAHLAEAREDGTHRASVEAAVAPLLRVVGLDVAPTPSTRLPTAPFHLELRAGERMVIVGPRGSGKSLLARAFVGAAQPAHGQVLLGGRPLAAYDLRDRGAQVRGLLQTDRLCNDSILGNLRVGNPDVPVERLHAACAHLGVDAEIRALPLGYETPVLDDGRALSRGQRQLLLLARTIAADAALTVLDEPLAHLDQQSARTTLDALLRSTRTLLIVSADECPFADAGFRVVSLAPSPESISS